MHCEEVNNELRNPRKSDPRSFSSVPNPPPNIRPVSIPDHCLDQKLLNLNLHAVNGTLELRSFVGGNGARNNGARDSAGTSKSDLAVTSRE
jgi:hypothetical protein